MPANPNTVAAIRTTSITATNAAANDTYPSPHASPAAMVKNTMEISFALPGALLNLTSAKAPAMENALATLLPTRRITTATTAGRIARPIMKFF